MSAVGGMAPFSRSEIQGLETVQHLMRKFSCPLALNLIVFILALLYGWSQGMASTALLEPESGPNDGVYKGIIAASINAKPAINPSMGVWLRGPDMPYLAAVFPGAPDLRIDNWMYESCTNYFTFAGVTVNGENQLE